MKDKITVIVPVYNVEKYLDRCLKSLVNQTYKNLEIIIVEDCSTDNSKKILKKYINMPNFKILYNKKNYGLSYSRNKGLMNATGKYIGFVDSDDFIEKNFFESLYESIIEESADLAICDINLFYEKSKESKKVKASIEDNVDAISIIDNGLASACWNKLFVKNQLIYKFEENKINEDIAFVIPYILNAKKISYTDKSFYNYAQRDDSIQNSDFNFKKFDIFYGVDLALNRIKHKKYYEKVKDLLVYHQLMSFLFYVIPKEKKFINRLKILKQYQKLVKKYNCKNNESFRNFLNEQNGIYKFYYTSIVLFNENQMFILNNILISVFRFMSRIKKILNT